MRYKIFNLDQSVLVDLGLGVEESLLLDWILNWKDGTGMKRAYFEEKEDIGYWINYSTVVEELPILFKQVKEGMTEAEIAKLKRNNKDKVGRLIKKLKSVLTPIRKVKQDSKGKQGSEVYVVLNREVIDKLKGFENKKVAPAGTDTTYNKTDKNIKHDSIICEDKENMQEENIDLEEIALNRLREIYPNFDFESEKSKAIMIKNEVMKLKERMILRR